MGAGGGSSRSLRFSRRSSASSARSALVSPHARGYETAFSAVPPGGGRVAYFDTRDVLPGMTELIEASETLNARSQPP